MELGADGVELDVHLSRDDELVVIHDEYVDRTTDGHGMVREHSVTELGALNAAAHFRGDFPRQGVPTLSDVVDALGQSWSLLNIEIKSGIVVYPGIEQKLAEFVRRRSIESKVVFSSFNHYSLVELKRLAPECRTGILYMAGLVEPWHYARRIGAEALHPLHYNIFPEFVSGAHLAGVSVNTWTVDTPADIARVIRAGVDAVITNDPGTAVRIRDVGGRALGGLRPERCPHACGGEPVDEA
jgi:glycerophosphoryl diester phosphodiesterase